MFKKACLHGSTVFSFVSLLCFASAGGQAQTPVFPDPNWAQKAVGSLSEKPLAPSAPVIRAQATVSKPSVTHVKVPVKKSISTASKGRSYILNATAYNSFVGQTDATPNTTATGTRTRFGVVALSREMLKSVPYGSRVMIEDLTPGSRYNRMLSNTVFLVEDTMSPKKRGYVDVWMSSRSQAFAWGHRQVKLTVLR